MAEEIGVDYGTIRTYGSVSSAFQLSTRIDKLTFAHHQIATAASSDRRVAWLKRAEQNEWSVGKLKSEIAREAAIDRTMAIEFDAAKLGKFAVLYAILSNDQLS